MFILNPRYHSGTLNAATSVRWAKMTKEQMLVIKPTRRNLANEFLQLIGDRSIKKKKKHLEKIRIKSFLSHQYFAAWKRQSLRLK